MKGGRKINAVFIGIQENTVLVTALIAWAIAQISKTMISAFEERRINFRRLVDSGGMPSAHSTFVTSLATAIGIIEGWASTTFALATAFALIVMYDAAGVRQAAGRQARVLNRIVVDLNKKDFHPERLKELVGHTPVEVLIGAIVGISLAFWRLG